VRAVLTFAGLCLATALPLLAQGGGKEEVFEAVDPYTRGQAEALAKAGYKSFGPFAWGAKHDTKELAQTVGGVAILFVETPHFKLASSLKSYECTNDKRENERVAAELKRLKARLPRIEVRERDLDPWLRVHLYAQRLEELYADFERRFGVSDADFALDAEGKMPPGMGEGPFLGQKEKFTVLLAEKNSTLARYVKRYFDADEERCFRAQFKEGGWFFGITAESRQTDGAYLDAALHCVLVEGMVHNLIDAFRNEGWRVPPWFKHGAAHGFARTIDERWFLFGGNELVQSREEEYWVWEPRVFGLVSNKAAPPWTESLTWQDQNSLSGHAHMVVWSRVQYLFQLRNGKQREFLMALTERPPDSETGFDGRASPDRQNKALVAAYGSDAEALDAAWARWVQKTYAKK
jgi:hypothetical protein